MSLPESNLAPQQASEPQAKVLDRSAPETGDLTAQFDFYQTNNTPAVVDGNDPNVDPNEVEDAFEEPEAEGESDDSENTTDEESGEVEEAEEGEGEEVGDSEGEGEESEESEQKAKKTAKIAIGDKDYDVPLDAIIPTPVNGEIDNPTLQDLRNAYAAKANIRKEVEASKAAKLEVDAHRRKVVRDLEKKEVALIEKEFNTGRAQKALASGDFETALNELFEFDHDKWNRFDELMMGYYTEFAKLQPAERRALQLDRQTKMMEARSHRATEATAMQQHISAFNNYKATRCEAAGVTEDEVEDAWDLIGKRAEKGEFSQAEIERLRNATPQQKWDVALSEALATKTRNKITEVVKSKFPKLANKTSDIVSNLEEKLSTKYLIKATKEDIAGIISREYNVSKAEQQKSAKKVATTNSLRDKAQPRHFLREAATQEDEDDLYDQSGRNEPANSVWGGQFSR